MENSNGIVIPKMAIDSCALIDKVQEEQINKTKTEETKASDIPETDTLSNDSLIGSKSNQSPPRIENCSFSLLCDRQISFSYSPNSNHFILETETKTKESSNQQKRCNSEHNTSVNNLENELLSENNQFQHQSYSFIYPYDKCKSIQNPSSLPNINMKIFRQNYQLNNQNKNEKSEFSVLHSNFLNEKSPTMNMMNNNESFIKTNLSAELSDPSVKIQNQTNNNTINSNRFNFSLNSITMFNNMAIQMKMLKIMMQQQFLMQNQTKKLNPTQYTQSMKDCVDSKQPISSIKQKTLSIQQTLPQQLQQLQSYQQQQQQQQQRQQQYFQSIMKMNIQNNLSSNKAGTFIHPYIPANNQIDNPLFNYQKILQQIKEKLPKKADIQQNNTESSKTNSSHNQQFNEDYLSKGNILKGIIQLDRSRTQGYVKVKGLTNEIYISEKSLYQSLNQDEVLVKLYPVFIWKSCASIKEKKISVFSEDSKKIISEEDNKISESNQIGKTQRMIIIEKNGMKKEMNKMFSSKEDLLKYCNSFSHLRPEGQIIKILKSPKFEKEQVCYLEHYNSILHAFPIDETLPRIFILQKKNQDSEILLKNRYYIVKLQGWDKSCQCLQGEIINELGNCGNIEVESEVLLRHYKIDYNQVFPPSILNEVQNKINSLVINDEFIKETGRTDLRKEIIFTVDPTCSKDLDDAISVKLIDKAKGLLEIGVHIADPSYLVTKDSLLDLEAIKRVTTIYLVQKNIPMLPKIISDSYCSLLPFQDRLTVTCSFRIFLNGSLDPSYKPKFELSVIQSKAKWNYNLVQKIITGEGIDYKKLREEEGTKPRTIEIFNQMVEGIHLLQRLTKVVRMQRFQSGSLVIQNTNLNFIIDDKTLLPTGYRLSKKADSHNLIEELMIIANKLCAEYLYENMREYSIIRRHPFVNDNTFEEIKRYLISHGIKVQSKIPLEFNNKMNDLKKNEQQFYCIQNKLKNLLVKAEYVISGQSPFKSLCHSSLNFDLYTHFTSPIRRYSDMIVHRQLKDIIDFKNKKITEDKFKEHFACYNPLMDQFNEKYFVGKQISDKSSWLFKCIYIKNSNRKEYKGLIVDLYKTSEKSKTLIYEGLSVLFYIPDLHLEIEWKKEDNANVTKAQITSLNELLIEYKNSEKKEVKRTFTVFDSLTVQLNVVMSGPLNVTCCLKLD